MMIAVVLDTVARRLHLPSASVLVLAGIALALVPGLPEVEFDPDFVMVLFLPPLLLSGAYFTVWPDFRANLRIILQLAVGAVVVTTLLVGVVAHFFFPALPWSLCVNNAEVLRDVAVKGRGIALIPEFIAAEALKNGSLQAVLANYSAPPLVLYAVYPPTRHLAVKVRLFIDFLVERFGWGAG